MLGWNCILVGLLAPVLFPGGRVKAGLRTSALLAGIGSLLVLASYVRISLYPAVEQAVKKPDLLTAFLGAALVNKNDPLLPFLGFALIGAALGHAFSQDLPRRRLLGAVGLFSLVWLAAGIIGYLALPDTMLERSVDEMWYAIIVLQVGLFSFLLLAVWRFADVLGPWARARRERYGLIILCGRASLTIFFWETPVRSLYALLWDAVYPGWSSRIPVVLLFGLSMSLLWILALQLWKRALLVGSMEWMVGHLYSVLGRRSAKEEALAPARHRW
jgi:hypothetical protein